MKNRLKKNDCMDFHVLKRFRQRFSKNFDRRDIRTIVAMILEGKTEPIYALSNIKKLHIVSYNGISFCCVYNKQRKRIHTVFPVEWLEDGSYDELLKRNGYVEVVI